MSFVKYKRQVCDGDTAVLYLGFDNMLTYVVKWGKVYQTKYGAIKCDDLIGTEYGSRFKCSRGFVYILHPTPELWTQTLPHRTQILYSTDISMITLQLDLHPGSVVVEAGTGSGSLSHAIIRNILPTGHLHTFEFHEQRVEKAQQEFKTHGLEDFVTITHRDVVKNGFQLDHIADAVFLDLPSPWSVIPSAKQALKVSGGRMCSFSPCIEQVQRTCDTLREEGFTELSTMECLVRNYVIRNIGLPLAHFGDTVTESDGPPSPKKRMTELSDTPPAQDTFNTEDLIQIKIKKEISISPSVAECKTSIELLSKEETSESLSAPEKSVPKEEETYSFDTASTTNSMPGHTGYLTFATLYPA